MGGAGVPPEMIEAMVDDSRTVKMAATMLHDIEVMGEITFGGSIPEDVMRNIERPTLVLAGGASPQFFRDAAERLVGLLPLADLKILEDQDHGAEPAVVAAAIRHFVGRAPPATLVEETARMHERDLRARLVVKAVECSVAGLQPDV